MKDNRVLFVDDDPLARKAFARAMRQRGFIVDIAQAAEEALEFARTYPYAVVASDWKMPRTTGLHLIQQVRDKTPGVSCILVSGAAADVEPRSIGLLGIIAVIQKPWDNDHLEKVLKDAILIHLERAQVTRVSIPPLTPRTAILMVEDSASDAKLITRLLRKAGVHDVTVRESLGAAIAELSERKFDALLVNMTLPDATGIASVQALKPLCGGAPIVVLTCRDDEKLGFAAMQEGAQDYLSKSDVNAESLNRAIRYSIERKRGEDRLAHIAHHDQLTNLANRTLLLERLNQAIGRAERNGTLIAVLFLDLDRFKGINDTLGHHIGDLLLTEVATRLLDTVRTADTVARLGGDEFAILVEDLADSNTVVLLARRLLNSFATPFVLDGTTVATSTSVGIALYPENGEDIERLLKSADSALYRAKQTGRNDYQFFSEELHERAVRRAQLAQDLELALAANEFVPFFQPQIKVPGGTVVGLEALIRWKKRDGSMVSPGEFIPVLEECGLIVAVGEWMLRTVCNYAVEWGKQLNMAVHVAVNVSGRQVEGSDFVSTVEHTLETTGIDPKWLELEVTESVMMKDCAHSQDVLEKLRELGIRISLDDFGTGYSSLGLLKNLPIDTLKIDRSFVKDLPEDRDAGAIAATVITLAKRMSLDVVAEGVETQEQLDFLIAEGCETIQGYFFSKPMAPEDTFAWLSEPAHQPNKKDAA